jgi:predicted metal-binding membrane protein
MTAALEALVRRDRVLVTLSLVALAGLAWAWVAHLARGMTGPGDMAMAMPHMAPWGPADVALAVAMWAVMMVAMMLPGAAPMVLLFAAVNRRRAAAQGPAVRTGLFLLGYLALWGAWSVGAALAQWGLQAAALITAPTLVVAPWLGGLLLLAAGIYQFTPLKDVCLARCQSPLGFLMTEWREGPGGALVMGLRHGLFCVGCCWALMALLFVAGVMNLFWVAALALFVLAEKVLPLGRLPSRLAGAGLLAWGGWLLAGALSSWPA